VSALKPASAAVSETHSTAKAGIRLTVIRIGMMSTRGPQP
jgi:hypothetical protein